MQCERFFFSFIEHIFLYRLPAGDDPFYILI